METSALFLTAIALPVGALALIIERPLGYPPRLQSLLGHPVEWIGALIARLDHTLNSGSKRKLRGLLAMIVVSATTLALTLPLTWFLRGFEYGWIGEALLASVFLSQKSLADHVGAVREGLNHSLEAGREAVRHIVGRDPEALDENGVSRAALESLAENMSDGVLAPLFWLLVGGLPGIALYKAINTADSMIGYRTDKYKDFGWAAARIDDLVNLIPARITGLLIGLAADLSPRFSGNAARRAIARDAHNHLSPNAGWPEAALAGALGISLGGPRNYHGHKTELAWMGDGRTELSANDIDEGLKLYNIGLNITVALVAFAALIVFAA